GKGCKASWEKTDGVCGSHLHPSPVPSYRRGRNRRGASAESRQGPARTATQACVGTDDTVSGGRTVARRADVVLGNDGGVLSAGSDEQETVPLSHGWRTPFVEVGGRVVPWGHRDSRPVPRDETALGRGILPVRRGKSGGGGIRDASSANAAARQGWLRAAQLSPLGEGIQPEGGEKEDCAVRDHLL